MTELLAGNLLDHPLSVPDWELAEASPIRTYGRSMWRPGPSATTGAPSPDDRIVHARAVQGVSGPLDLRRIGIRRGVGYHKCASAQEWDAPASVRLLAHRGGRLEEVGRWELDSPPEPDEVRWMDAPVVSETLVAVVEDAFIDRGWPSWNVARTGVILDGAPTTPWQRPPFALLEARGDVPATPAPGVRAVRGHDEVRFRTRFLEVGFRLRSASLSYLSVDADGTGRTERDLLQRPRSMDIVRTGLYPAGVYPVLRDAQASYLANGPRLTLLDGREPAGFLGYSVRGSTTLDGDQVIYDLVLGDAGVSYRLAWTIREQGLTLDVERTVDESLTAWQSSAWHVPLDNRVASSTVLGALVGRGETGLVRPPATWHVPAFGSFVVEGSDGVLLRSDSVRPLDTNTLEIKVAETPGPDGTYDLPAGRATGTVRFEVRTPGSWSPLPARPQRWHVPWTAPCHGADVPRRHRHLLEQRRLDALRRVARSARGCRRGDRGCSLGAYAADGIDPVGFLERSIPRWLSGAPGYGSGNTSRGDFTIEDEYLMLGADALYGLGRLLGITSEAWFVAHEPAITRALDTMRSRDLDGDGLVESPHRRGVTGEHQWSTTWADVVSFGWKDAWSNAVLYGALRLCASGMRRFGRAPAADDLDAWAARLRSRTRRRSSILRPAGSSAGARPTARPTTTAT